MQVMNIQDILKFLPHRYPFLLVDRVLTMEKDQSIVALKNVTMNEHFFQGHFPDKAVMPGVLIIEALAQAAGILAYKSTEWEPGSSLFYLGSIAETRFKKIVVPGDQLTLKVSVLKRRTSVWKFTCEAFVDSESVCSTEMTCVAEAIPASKISKDAQVDPKAILADDVVVGPYAIIGPNVEIGAGTVVGAHVVIKGPTKIGANNKFYQFSSIGEDCQDKKYHGEDTKLIIGDNNVFREGCTVHRGTVDGGGQTVIGSNNLFMVNTHVAHDCIIGNNVIFSNNASIAGHVRVDDYASLGGFVGVHQFCLIGAHSFIAAGSIILKDVAPFVTVSGHPAQAHGLNTVGLTRRDFSVEVLNSLKQAYKIVFRTSATVKDAINELNNLMDNCAEVLLLRDFLQQSTRGVVR